MTLAELERAFLDAQAAEWRAYAEQERAAHAVLAATDAAAVARAARVAALAALKAACDVEVARETTP